MVIRYKRRRKQRRQPDREPQVVTTGDLICGLAQLLHPTSMVAAALGLWRLGADLGLASPFALDDGPLSHWQTWIAIAVLLESVAVSVNRRFRSGEDGEAPA